MDRLPGRGRGAEYCTVREGPQGRGARGPCAGAERFPGVPGAENADAPPMRTSLWSSLLAVAVVTSGNFSVNGVARHATSAAATIEPRLGAPGYSWLRIYFFPSALSAHDRALAASGHVKAIARPWSAVLQYCLDANGKAWQTDLALPGYTCTVAASDVDSRRMLSDFEFDGHTLKLASAGAHTCDMSGLGVANPSFTWKVALTTPVVPAAR